MTSMEHPPARLAMRLLLALMDPSLQIMMSFATAMKCSPSLFLWEYCMATWCHVSNRSYRSFFVEGHRNGRATALSTSRRLPVNGCDRKGITVLVTLPPFSVREHRFQACGVASCVACTERAGFHGWRCEAHCEAGRKPDSNLR